MKSWKLKFNEEVFSELKTYLFSNAPLENGCFILGKAKGKLLFIQEIFLPESDEIVREEGLCIPSAK